MAGLFSLSVIADEGMWLPQLLKTMNESDMQAHGLQMTAEDLYSVNNSSLKDAIVSLGGFCTAEMISSEGLMLTNHHCAFGSIQEHSSVSNDYIKDGFWAMSRDEELVNEGLTASFLVSIEEVTARVLAELTDDMTEKERSAKIREIAKTIVDEKTEDTHYNARVKSFFGGNDFYIMTYETFKDVRLVGAPPSAIGKFGGDTDNWMWPRHTGDFALYRIYCAPDGTPAEYSVENVAYQPKHHLPIQLDGVDNGDYTMIFGFPGSTDRYLTSFGVQQALDITSPTTVDIRTEKLAIMKAGMDANKRTKIQYAAKYAQTSNYWKYFIGQSKGLKSMKVHDKKVAIEDDFRSWVAEDQSRVDKYGEALNLIESAYNTNKKIALNRTYLNEAVFQGSEIMYWSFKMNRAIAALPAAKSLNGRATGFTAHALLGKVYLYQNKFDEAASILEPLVGLYSLPSDFQGIFLNSGENGSGSVFEVQHSKNSNWFDWGFPQGSEGSFAIIHHGPRGYNGGTYSSGWSFNVPTQNLYDAYGAGDSRRDVAILDIVAWANSTGAEYAEGYEHTGYFNHKYIPRSGSTAAQGELNYENNFRAIRYADVLLMAAEANNRKTSADDAKALNYLNQVRARAYGNSSQASSSVSYTHLTLPTNREV